VIHRYEMMSRRLLCLGVRKIRRWAQRDLPGRFGCGSASVGLGLLLCWLACLPTKSGNPQHWDRTKTPKALVFVWKVGAFRFDAANGTWFTPFTGETNGASS